jgi:hypothetical protein
VRFCIVVPPETYAPPHPLISSPRPGGYALPAGEDLDVGREGKLPTKQGDFLSSLVMRDGKVVSTAGGITVPRRHLNIPAGSTGYFMTNRKKFLAKSPDSLTGMLSPTPGEDNFPTSMAIARAG